MLHFSNSFDCKSSFKIKTFKPSRRTIVFAEIKDNYVTLPFPYLTFVYRSEYSENIDKVKWYRIFKEPVSYGYYFSFSVIFSNTDPNLTGGTTQIYPVPRPNFYNMYSSRYYHFPVNRGFSEPCMKNSSMTDIDSAIDEFWMSRYEAIAKTWNAVMDDILPDDFANHGYLDDGVSKFYNWKNTSLDEITSVKWKHGQCNTLDDLKYAYDWSPDVR